MKNVWKHQKQTQKKFYFYFFWKKVFYLPLLSISSAIGSFHLSHVSFICRIICDILCLSSAISIFHLSHYEYFICHISSPTWVFHLPLVSASYVFYLPLVSFIYHIIVRHVRYIMSVICCRLLPDMSVICYSCFPLVSSICYMCSYFISHRYFSSINYITSFIYQGVSHLPHMDFICYRYLYYQIRLSSAIDVVHLPTGLKKCRYFCFESKLSTYLTINFK